MSSDQSGGRGREGWDPASPATSHPSTTRTASSGTLLPSTGHYIKKREPKRKSEKEKGERMRVKRGKRVGWARQRRGSLFRANWVNLQAMEKETRKTD